MKFSTISVLAPEFGENVSTYVWYENEILLDFKTYT